MTGPQIVRCGLDLDHEPHEHDGGQCDGGIAATAGVPAPVGVLDALFVGITNDARPWSWATLTAEQADTLAAQLDLFVAHYNATFVVDERHLVHGCWPLHPGLAHELAALHAQWVVVHQGGMATAEAALHWHDRWLPGFQRRVADQWFGTNGQGCRPDHHKPEWNPAAAQLAKAAKRPEGFELDDAVAALRRIDAHIDH